MSSETGRPRAVVCLSGGMDSCVCAALAARDYEVYAIHFSYGQRTEARELRSAEEVARIVGVRELLPLKIDLFRRIGGSALTDPGIAVPAASANEAPAYESRTGSEIPVTYVPFRNAHFLSAAVSWAEVLGAQTVLIVRLGVELGAPFHVSWSCYSGETEACGVCESCVLRLRAFREAEAVDLIPYAVA
jgi:7-cyano-7-deazaguanine synthase